MSTHTTAGRRRTIGLAAAGMLLGLLLAGSPARAVGAPASVETEAIDKLISPTDMLKVRATVLDADGNPVPGVLVSITIETLCNSRVSRIVTNADGIANYHISGSQTLCVGNAYVTGRAGAIIGNTDSARIFIDSQPVW